MKKNIIKLPKVKQDRKPGETKVNENRGRAAQTKSPVIQLITGPAK